MKAKKKKKKGAQVFARGDIFVGGEKLKELRGPPAPTPIEVSVRGHATTPLRAMGDEVIQRTVIGDRRELAALLRNLADVVAGTSSVSVVTSAEVVVLLRHSAPAPAHSFTIRTVSKGKISGKIDFAPIFGAGSEPR